MGKKKTDNEVQEILLSYGYKKIGPYIGARMPIKCMDLDGYIVYPVLYCLYDGKTPLRFHQSNPNTIDNINLYLSNQTNDEYLCVSNIYNGNKEPLTILHKTCNRTFNAKWINLYRKPSVK